MTDVVIPAHNEALGIERVLTAVYQAGTRGRIIVVDDASSDATYSTAMRWADVTLRIGARDKGSAMAAGLEHVETEDVLFVDADLIGLEPGHVDFLIGAAPRGGMAVGLRDEIRSVPTRAFPPISGERRLPTGFARSVGFTGEGYRAELMIDAAVGKAHLPHRSYVLPGVKNPSRAATHPLRWATMFADLALTSLVYLPELVAYSVETSR